MILTPLLGFPFIHVLDDLVEVIHHSLQQNQITLQNGDILVLAQKIVSKAEGRFLDLNTIKPSENAMKIAQESKKDPKLIQAIIQESQEVLRIRPGVIIVKHRLGFVCANAGIDHSNVGPADEMGSHDWVLLLPENPDRSAQKLRDGLGGKNQVAIGVLIIDSHGRAWRLGTVGVSIGIAGVPAIVNLIGREDLFGYTLRSSQISAADELAAAASLVMGQANEGTPVIHVRGFPYPLCESTAQDLIRPKELDLFL